MHEQQGTHPRSVGILIEIFSEDIYLSSGLRSATSPTSTAGQASLFSFGPWFVMNET